MEKSCFHTVNLNNTEQQTVLTLQEFNINCQIVFNLNLSLEEFMNINPSYSLLLCLICIVNVIKETPQLFNVFFVV